MLKNYEQTLNCKLSDEKNYISQGIEKKTAKLKGSEKAVVARHEAGHAVVGMAVANFLPGQPRVEVNYGNILLNIFSLFLYLFIYYMFLLSQYKFENDKRIMKLEWNPNT